MIKGINKVLEFFSTLNTENENTFIYWTLYKKGTVEKGYPLFSSPTNREGWNYIQSYDLLKKALGWQEFGEFTLIINDSEKVSNRGAIKQDFSLDMNQPAASISGPVIGTEEIQSQINKGIAEAMEKLEKERELKELKEKAAKLEKENKVLLKKAEDPWNVLIGEIKPYVPDLMQEAGIIKQKVAGIPASDVKPVAGTDTAHPANEVDQEVQIRLETIVKKFFAARPDDWLEILELMANAVEKNPALADTVKKFL